MLVAIAGAPGSGKSTLAAQVVSHFNTAYGTNSAALVPMDGFHFSNDFLDAKKLRAVKGAPETFNISELLALVQEIRAGGRELAYPLFDRDKDETIPDAGHLGREVQTVILEGNYLLLGHGEWAKLGPLFDVSVMLRSPLPILRNRLIARWLDLGMGLTEATARVDTNDLVNARTVICSSTEAHLTLDHVSASEASPTKSRLYIADRHEVGPARKVN